MSCRFCLLRLIYIFQFDLLSSPAQLWQVRRGGIRCVCRHGDLELISTSLHLILLCYIQKGRAERSKTKRYSHPSRDRYEQAGSPVGGPGQGRHQSRKWIRAQRAYDRQRNRQSFWKKCEWPCYAVAKSMRRAG